MWLPYVVLEEEKGGIVFNQTFPVPLITLRSTRAKLRRWRGVGGGTCTTFLVVTKDTLPEIFDHLGETLPQWYLWFPTKKLFSPWDIRLPLVWIIFSVGPELYFCIWVNCFLDHLQQNNEEEEKTQIYYGSKNARYKTLIYRTCWYYYLLLKSNWKKTTDKTRSVVLKYILLPLGLWLYGQGCCPPNVRATIRTPTNPEVIPSLIIINNWVQAVFTLVSVSAVNISWILVRVKNLDSAS